MIGLYAVGGSSFGMHESQSRLFENHIGRSADFWALHFDRLKSHFPDQLGDVSEAEFVCAVNRTEPGLVRVEADELTYDLHIMLRVRIEMALMDGSLAVDDVPEAWNTAMREDLGIDVPHDGLGCLQDVHWSSGYIGSFPTYTIGNVTAAQIMARLDETEPSLRDAAKMGDLAPLRARLGAIVWQHGRSKTDAKCWRRSGRMLKTANLISTISAANSPRPQHRAAKAPVDIRAINECGRRITPAPAYSPLPRFSC
nr:hypothetical protein [Marinicella sp. W31]MDC2876211.1 hypothetical protein [Marinicella sp. W31]